MTKNGENASIREVYAITQRLEEKIDSVKVDIGKVDKKVANLQGKASILAIVWSSVISLVAIFIGYFWIKK